jgi:hypothetical protein
MANKELSIYLNNHLTASVTALALLASLEEKQAGTDIASFAAQLRAEIEAEQQLLETIMEQLQITKSKQRQALGWLAEMFTQAKLSLDGSKDSPLHLLESLELLLVAIEGKRGLWNALAAATVPGLPISEYERLAAKSEEQQKRVEAFRLAAAKAAFAE